MYGHEAKHSEFSPLAAAVHSCLRGSPLEECWIHSLSGAPALWGCIRFLTPSRAGTKTLGALSPSVVSAMVPESQTHLTQMVALLWELSKALICFISIFTFSKGKAYCSEPQSHLSSSFTSKCKGRRNCARWGIKVLYKGLPLLYIHRIWIGWPLIKPSFWDNVGLT